MGLPSLFPVCLITTRQRTVSQIALNPNFFEDAGEELKIRVKFWVQKRPSDSQQPGIVWITEHTEVGG